MQPEKHQSSNEVTEEGIVSEVRPMQSSKQLTPNEVTEEGIVSEVRPTQSLKQLAPNEVILYSTPSLLLTFSGTTISPEYLPLLAITEAVFVPVSNK